MSNTVKLPNAKADVGCKLGGLLHNFYFLLQFYLSPNDHPQELYSIRPLEDRVFTSYQPDENNKQRHQQKNNIFIGPLATIDNVGYLKISRELDYIFINGLSLFFKVFISTEN